MNRDSGFTMIEVVVSLVMFGLIALVAGMGIVSFAKGYVFTRDSTHMAQKAQLAMIQDQRFQHPYFWAGFQMIGDYR